MNDPSTGSSGVELPGGWYYRLIEVSGTGPATAAHGGIAVSGIAVSGIADISVQAGPVVRSAYLEQVRRIAPERLLDRDEELAELASFCLEAVAAVAVQRALSLLVHGGSTALPLSGRIDCPAGSGGGVHMPAQSSLRWLGAT